MAVITTLGVPDNQGNTTTIMPKLAYRFRVNFIGESFSGVPTRSVISVTRPSLTHDEVLVDAYNSRIYLAGKHTWDPVTVVLRDDVDSAVLRELNNQLNRQVDHANQASSRAGDKLRGTIMNDRLDIEDNIGESIHIHYKNIRMDFTIRDFLKLAIGCSTALNKLHNNNG